MRATNPRWRTADILKIKIEKSLHHGNALTDHYEILARHAFCPNELCCVRPYTMLTTLHNVIEQNWLQFLFVVKAIALKHQMSKFYLNIFFRL